MNKNPNNFLNSCYEQYKYYIVLFPHLAQNFLDGFIKK